MGCEWQVNNRKPLPTTANKRNRRILGGQSAAQAYHQQPRARFDKRERHIIFEWIKIRSDVIMQQMDKADHRSLDAAWRHAMETGLRCQNLISLTTNQKCHPNYNSNRYH